ncbi:MAG TPA: acetyl-CoA carboxylase biotin carboxyl carrier protein [Candidatus Hydrogenedentes bacterium]|nr:acetyl-CoA carboxylase biotin carboxyl carrier protein [Candidatus Hydrogenedentota bacterium]HOS03677.1 acetyl-CoA carboxylase biotin carboxyl carrier protein [Candidatus Hydrogenedentota bacterium]
MDLEQFRELIRIFEESALSQVEIEESGLRIQLKKPEPPVAPAPTYAIAAPHPAGHAAPMMVQAFPQTAPPPAPAPAVPAAPSVASVAAEDEGLVTIDSPLVGVFYAAPAPGEPPFVREGDVAEEKQTVCIIEAMKVMNEVVAKFPCVIEKILVQNGEPIEFGQPLFAVRPTEPA